MRRAGFSPAQADMLWRRICQKSSHSDKCRLDTTRLLPRKMRSIDAAVSGASHPNLLGALPVRYAVLNSARKYPEIQRTRQRKRSKFLQSRHTVLASYLILCGKTCSTSPLMIMQNKAPRGASLWRCSGISCQGAKRNRRKTQRTLTDGRPFPHRVSV